MSKWTGIELKQQHTRNVD